MSTVFALTMLGAVLLTINRDIGELDPLDPANMCVRTDLTVITGPSNSYTWMVTAQIVGQSVLAPQMGRFADIFGRRNFLLLGNALAIIGCALGATAQSVNTVIGGSALIGVGGSMQQLAWTCLGELVPKRDRGMALGFLETSILPASTFGPVIGVSDPQQILLSVVREPF